jgi:two-component system sensor histidine kinase UhpB
MMEIHPGIENTDFFRILRDCMHNRHAGVLEHEFTFPNGTKQWFELSVQPVSAGLFILFMDIDERKKAEQLLKESEQFLNKTQEVSKIGSYVLDYTKGLWKASHELDNIFGLEPNDTHSIESWLSIIHPDHKTIMHDYFTKEVIGRKQRFDKEYKIVNKKTQLVRWVHGFGDLIFDTKGAVIKMLGTIQDISERKKLEQELAEQKQQQQRLITETAIKAQEKERSELGRELHDNVNQILATVKMFLGMVSTGNDTPDENVLTKSYEYVDEAMKEIRKLSHSLVAPSLGDLGLKEALTVLANDTNMVSKFKVRLKIDDKYHEQSLDKQRQLMIYRVVQEQLNNISKYANAKETVISLKTMKNNLLLSICDNGDGFDMSKKTDGIGLKNISNRVEFYSGEMNIVSAPGEGCTLHVCIPFPDSKTK